MQVEVKLALPSDVLHARDCFDLILEAGDDRTSDEERPRYSVPAFSRLNNVRVGQFHRKNAVGEILPNVAGHGKVYEDGAEQVGLAAMDVEHVDIFRINVFDPHLHIDFTQIVREA